MDDTVNFTQLHTLFQTVIPTSQPPIESTAYELLLANNGRTFHFAARFLPSKLRGDVVTLYAFFRVLDDLVDKPPQGYRAEDIRSELEDWRYWFREDCSFPAPKETLGTKLASVLTEHSIPAAIFLDFLDGMISDLEPKEIDNFGEMYRYCYRVAGTVGIALAHLLGARSVEALAAAERLGVAMQLTNILRDVGGDLTAGRIYLPQDELARFDCSQAHLSRLYRDQRGPDERFRALMRFQIARAHHYYVQGMSGIWLLPVNCRLPILIASRLYRRILTVIERKGYDVLHMRAATSLPEKVREATVAFALDRLWQRGEAYSEVEGEALLES